MQEQFVELRQMLGGRSVAQFGRLPQAERNALFRHHLVHNHIIVSEAEDDDGCDPRIASGFLLRQHRFMGNDETGKQLVKDANGIYYGENRFLVRLHWLCEFMSERLEGEETDAPIAPLVGNIIVEVDLHDNKHERLKYDSDGESDCDGIANGGESSRLAAWTVNRLRDLFLFTKATSITLRLQGGGMPDGSDLATHQTIKDIAEVVKELIGSFGNRFEIGKMLDSGDRPYQSLRDYWMRPTEQARINVSIGCASFKEMMQIEIEEWTHNVPSN
ncbi:hypothetical protein VFPPC_06908 [Pochonia chlamydosporia 170]|uniref:Uncharacterized protein n=1 Tax=Pochonia chlamydosporia 170 TaxID=1380566 RepID=A0A179FAL0_METCM|nr:hypothetical protein VFPPC_06908 [Pochonia chlamydosporia 170]OAQ62468.1 hypothetical protein VFPPC_06908 [Pochonia chlamydosporia 170]